MNDRYDQVTGATTVPFYGWLLKIAGTAAAYFLAGKLSLLLAIPPGYATAVWPPSGIALSSVLLFSYRVWPGILIGSFCVNVFTSLDTSSTDAIIKSLALPAVIGAGASLQALIGVFLINRFVGQYNPLNREQNILKFFLLAGPVSCLTNATIGPAAMMLFGIITWSNYLFTWWTWWIGDSIGVIVMTPLVLILMVEPGHIWRKKKTSVAYPLIAMLLLVISIFVYVKRQEGRRIRDDFERIARSVVNSLENNFNIYLENLKSIDRLFNTSSDIDRKKFRLFVKDIMAAHEGIQSLEWAPRVLDTNRLDFEEAVRREGYPYFQIKEKDYQNKMVRASRRDEYYPVYFVEPYKDNETAIGFDLASEQIRHESIIKARDTGEPITTGRVSLIQGKYDQFGFLILLPVFSNPLHGTIELRRQEIKGVALGIFSIGELIDKSLKGLMIEDIDFILYDDRDENKKRFLFNYEFGKSGERRIPELSQKEIDLKSINMRYSTVVNVTGRKWGIIFYPTIEYIEKSRSFQAWALLAGSMLFTGLLGMFLLVLSSRAERITQIVKERTEELIAAQEMLKRANIYNRTLLEASIDPLVTITGEGKIGDVNKATEHITGFSRDEIIGTNFSSYFTEPDKAMAGYKMVFEIGDVRNYELYIRHRSGHTIPVICNASVFKNESGEAIGVFAAARDITEMKKASEQLSDLNKNLEKRVEEEVAKRRKQEQMMIHQSKMATIGEMISAIAHQWRQPLNAISFVLIGLNDAFQHDELDKEYFDKTIQNIKAQLIYMSKTIDDFRNFLKPLREKILFSVNDSIESVIQLMHPQTISNNIEVTLKCNDAYDTFKVCGYPNELQQVVMNIISNAKDAIVSYRSKLKQEINMKGAIDITVSRKNTSVLIEIVDNGGGIDESIMDRIFNPYFTTKEKGTGIGLYMSKIIIENNMDGRLYVSNCEHGSVFTIELMEN
ncbi:MAG: CHASE domain-containing protein [Nitrospirae bacterium]|nr:CHASE domain-containing protein [Nitrospirota bacterium]